MAVLAFDLCAGARGWEAGNDDLGVETIGFDIDADACATARAAGLHAVQDDIARLVPAVVALIYGQPEGLIGSPPCQLFSAAGKGTGRLLMAELHRAMSDAAAGASDIVMARHRRELRRLLYVYLRETEGVGFPSRYAGRKRPRASKHRKPNGKPYAAESTPIRRGELRAEADRMARNVSLVWQPARWAARLLPRWIALEQVPAVLPLWESMARALEVHGYRCWTGVLSAERYGVPQTRKRAILLASLDGAPQPPEATHQAYVPGEPARESEPDLFGPGVLPWVSMAEALGWGMTLRPTTTVTATNGNGGPRPLDGGAHSQAILNGARDTGDWLAQADPEDIEVELNRGAGMVERHGERRPRKASEPSPVIRGGAGGGCGPNLTVKLRAGTGEHATERDEDEPAPTLHFGERANGVAFVQSGRPKATTRTADEPAPTIKGGHDSGDRQWVVDTKGGTREGGLQRALDEPARTVDPSVRQWTADRPAPTLTGSRRSKEGGLVGRQMAPGEREDVGGWPEERPATTVAGDARIFPPGHKINADDVAAGRGGQQRSGAGWTDGRPATALVGDARVTGPHSGGGRGESHSHNAVRVSVSEAAMLQSFPEWWPWQGTQTSQFQQVGNAVPPGLARPVLVSAMAPTRAAMRC